MQQYSPLKSSQDCRTNEIEILKIETDESIGPAVTTINPVDILKWVAGSAISFAMTLDE
jgi:hypothetical protein